MILKAKKYLTLKINCPLILEWSVIICLMNQAFTPLYILFRVIIYLGFIYSCSFEFIYPTNLDGDLKKILSTFCIFSFNAFELNNEVFGFVLKML